MLRATVFGQPTSSSGPTTARTGSGGRPRPTPVHAAVASEARSVGHVAHEQPRRPSLQSGQAASASFGRPQCGSPTPLGVTHTHEQEAMNFAVFASAADAVELCFFTEADLRDGKVTHSVALDSAHNKTGDIWHVQLPNVDSSLLYGYKLKGPHGNGRKAAAGHRYSEDTIVLDPYAQAVVSRRRFGELGKDLDYSDSDTLGLAPTWPQGACALPPLPSSYDWEGDAPLRLPMEDLVIYEMHVRGFTWDESSGVQSPGTFAGLTEKLDYLQALGVNAIELLPTHEFNELEYYQLIPGTDEYRFNFWGYSTTAFFAPMARYSRAALDGLPGAAVVAEFRDMVKLCHRRGIEVIMDVVFNHTAEGNEKGPTISFRGLDNRVYYMLAPQGQYYNYSGCGNTLNCNHPVVRKFILDCLRYWVLEMHVDGFRFDLASIMTRAPSVWHRAASGAASSLHTAEAISPPQPPPPVAGQPSALEPGEPSAAAPGTGARASKPEWSEVTMADGAGYPTGTPMSDPALIEMISEDPVLRDTKLIAEAWDCDGLNQVGAFPHFGGRWAEWNGHFRDTVRMFIKGTEGPWASEFASALCGSPKIFASDAGEGDWWGTGNGRKWRGNRGPAHSINFITAHDGFCLADLVAFDDKHNSANGEGNRDGESNNLTWNCGVEGPTDDLRVQRLRARQQRNLAAALLLSQGVPMVLMGDEHGHSKGGNNNTYCHDSRLNWLDWSQSAADETGFGRFFRLLVNFRRQRPELRQPHFVGPGGISWHGTRANIPDWSDSSRLVAFSLGAPDGGLYVAFNSSHLPATLELPDWAGRQWRPLIDTGKVAPYDFLQPDGRLSAEDIARVHKDCHMWTADSLYPLLPRACCVLESVPLSSAPSYAPYSFVEPTVRPQASNNGTGSAAARASSE